jgi:hypothetical protein
MAITATIATGSSSRRGVYVCLRYALKTKILSTDYTNLAALKEHLQALSVTD